VPFKDAEERLTFEAKHLADTAWRRISDFCLFTFTLTELGLLLLLTPGFTLVDWIYVVQNLLVLVIALTRRAPAAQDHSPLSTFAVGISCAYPYAQVICLAETNGYVAWPEAGLMLVTVTACLTLASLVSIGRFFGLRPALRGLATRGPYAFVRHPMYLAYFLSDIGYQLQEWNAGTLLLVLIGWMALIYRIRGEESVLSAHIEWPAYVRAVPYRLVPGIW
jgi:protein-S-isoprenylcysteine O-methyltransferase Ste14